MENISIKVHPPWYARGTPVINPRDGPAMALSEKPLFAIREGPSARGKTIKCMNELLHECMNEKGKRVRSGLDFIRLWLTLNTTFFNTKNSVFSQWYARLDAVFVDAVKSKDVDRSGERSADDFDFDLSAYAVPDNVEMLEDNAKMEEAVFINDENSTIWNMKY